MSGESLFHVHHQLTRCKGANLPLRLEFAWHVELGGRKVRALALDTVRIVLFGVTIVLSVIDKGLQLLVAKNAKTGTYF